jgi:rubredoxin
MLIFVLLFSDDNTTVEREKFNCKVCPLEFNTRKGLKLHINHRHHQVQKPVPTVAEVVYTDVNNFTTVNSTTFKCSSCAATFNTQRGVKVHILKRHNTTQAVVKRLKRRVHSSFVQKHYRCPDCGKNFNSYAQLYYHGYEHRGYPFECLLCGRMYTHRDRFRTHLIVEHNLDVESGPDALRTYNAKHQ